MTRYTANFHPQAWVNDYAIDVDPEGPTTCDVTGALVAMNESDRAAALCADTYDSDDIARLDIVPAWWRDWSGPFYVSVSVDENPPVNA